DTIIKNNDKVITLGGSAIYSSFSARSCYDGTIAVIGNMNKETNKKLIMKKITHIGKTNKKMTSFIINESLDTCVSTKYENNKFILTDKIIIKHLHISFRKGVDIDAILNNPYLKYKSLSIDVMIHSVKEFIPKIVKYINKIDIIFCNMKEYSLIKEYIEDIPLKIITNEDKPVIVINKESITFFEIKKINNIVSFTGAGDTFIGGFLAKYIKNKNIKLSVKQGIVNSREKLKHFGPLYNEVNWKNNILIKEYELPNNIIVIGNSCAGKTTFIDCFKEKYNIFSDIDDLEPLLEVFKLDDLLYENKIEDFLNIKEHLIYSSFIWEEYNRDLNNVLHYTKPSKSGKGHDIIRPILWDYIIKFAVAKCNNNNIIQFSRGYDVNYTKEYKDNPYVRSLSSFISKINQNLIIINLTSDLKTRKERNIIRFNNGGHYVSEETMDSVYGTDLFYYTKTKNNNGYIIINNKEYPVYNIINNKNLSKIDLNKFMFYNVNEVIKYYNEFKEDEKNEFKKGSKGNMAK
ncbi:MAG: PfkB family carbohydrate kinase, partial [bacterium]|nr:PfkB family carbohydrate kinase [bacterium]